MEECGQLHALERLLPKRGNGRLGISALNRLGLHSLALGDVLACADDLDGLALAVLRQLATGMQGTYGTIGKQVTMLMTEGRSRFESALESFSNPVPIVGMDQSEVAIEARLEGVRVEAEQAIELF